MLINQNSNTVFPHRAKDLFKQNLFPQNLQTIQTPPPPFQKGMNSKTFSMYIHYTAPPPSGSWRIRWPSPWANYPHNLL